jgi:hypothetical protein
MYPPCERWLHVPGMIPRSGTPVSDWRSRISPEAWMSRGYSLPMAGHEGGDL